MQTRFQILCIFTLIVFSAYSQRPSAAERRFNSEQVNSCINYVNKTIPGTTAARFFSSCFPSTLDTTVLTFDPQGNDAFIITGDIPALWLRDSAAQVWPYLPLCKKDERLRLLIRGLLRRQFRCILIDPYANAFNLDPNAMSPNWASDETTMKPGVFERKYELNSLCYPLRLAYGYWKATNDNSLFDTLWLNTVRIIYQTMKEQQDVTQSSPYTFMRVTDRMHDTMSNRGKGHPARPCGLIASAFRASDDCCIFPYNIPDNFMAASVLKRTVEILREVNHEPLLADSLHTLSTQIDKALKKYAVVKTEKYGDIYAFEVDGYGNHLLMDDANVPSLLSLPYISDVEPNDSLYKNTRNYVLSSDNPYYFRGSAGAGIGGPHVGMDFIWPMSIIMQAITSTDTAEIKACLTTLHTTDAGTSLMHEAFHKDDACNYTRPWFAWANTLYGELILKIIEEGNESILKD